MRPHKLGAKTVVQVNEKILPTTKHVFDRLFSGDVVKDVFNTKTGIASKQFWTGPTKDQRFAMVKRESKWARGSSLLKIR